MREGARFSFLRQRALEDSGELATWGERQSLKPPVVGPPALRVGSLSREILRATANGNDGVGRSDRVQHSPPSRKLIDVWTVLVADIHLTGRHQHNGLRINAHAPVCRFRHRGKLADLRAHSGTRVEAGEICATCIPEENSLLDCSLDSGLLLTLRRFPTYGHGPERDAEAIDTGAIVDRSGIGLVCNIVAAVGEEKQRASITRTGLLPRRRVERHA